MYAWSMVRLKYDGNVRDTRSDYVCTDLGADHDELKERAYMKRQMDARRKLERLEYETPQEKIDRQAAELSDMINSMRKESKHG